MLGGVCASSLVCEIDSDVSSSSDDDDDLKDQRAVSREDQVVPALPPDVPDWAIDEVVLEIWTSGVDVGGSRAAAPCIIWLQLAALSSFALQTSLYVLSRGQSSCVDGHVHEGTWWVWSPILPAMVFRFFVERKAVRHLALPVARKGGSFTAFGKEITFTVWLVLCTLFSGLNFMDICTDSLWAAQSERLLTCGGPGERLRELWGASWAQSAPARLGIPAPNLASLVTIFWCLALLQICVPLAKSLAACKRDVHVADPELLLDFERHRLGTPYIKDVAFDLAVATGMVTLEELQARQAHTMAEHHPTNVGAQLRYVAPLGETMAEKVLLIWFLENAFQLNLQTTFFALATRAARDDEELFAHEDPFAYYLTLLSILLGLLSTVMKLIKARHFLEIGNKIPAVPFIAQADPRDLARAPVAESATAVAESAKPFDEGERRNKEASINSQKLRRAILTVRAGVCLLVFTLAYAVAKLIATHICPDSIMHVTGCVVLDA